MPNTYPLSTAAGSGSLVSKVVTEVQSRWTARSDIACCALCLFCNVVMVSLVRIEDLAGNADESSSDSRKGGGLMRKCALNVDFL